MSFSCDACGNRNNEIQPAGQIQERGSRITFQATQSADLERQVVKSDSATFTIRNIELEIPPGRGRLTDLEGILSEVMTGLAAGQKTRQDVDHDAHEKIAAIIEKLNAFINGSGLPFTIILDDPAGNSSLEPSPKDASGKYKAEQYARSREQNAALGLGEQAEEISTDELAGVDILEGHPYELPVDCPGCTRSATIVLQMVNIPHFKQVVISSTRCGHCNYRASDVKTGGEIPERGRRTFVRIRCASDLQRDILKGEHCHLKIDQCGVEVQPGSMGGRFTTVEGLLSQIRDDLRASVFDAGDSISDSMPADKMRTWTQFFEQLDKALNVEFEFTIVMQDPIGGSFCQILGDADENVWHEEYERTAEEEDDLGLADMRTHLDENGEYVKEPISISQI